MARRKDSDTTLSEAQQYYFDGLKKSISLNVEAVRLKCEQLSLEFPTVDADGANEFIQWYERVGEQIAVFLVQHSCIKQDDESKMLVASDWQPRAMRHIDELWQEWRGLHEKLEGANYMWHLAISVKKFDENLEDKTKFITTLYGQRGGNKKGIKIRKEEANRLDDQIAKLAKEYKERDCADHNLTSKIFSSGKIAGGNKSGRVGKKRIYEGLMRTGVIRSSG